jgi:putative ABC transport system substrate-binding protein
MTTRRGDPATERRDLLGAFVALLVIAPLAGYAQQAASRVYRIGVLGAEGAGPLARFLDTLRSDLRDAGYVEGRNLLVIARHADSRYDRLPALAAELVRLDVDVIVTSGSKAGISAKEATSRVPIVVDNMGDAVQAGFVASYAQPGGNVTGISALNPEMTAKQLALLKEIVPRATVVAALMNPANPNYELTLRTLRQEAENLKLRVQPFDARSSAEMTRAIAAVAAARIDAMVVQSETLFAANAANLAELALKNRIAAAGLVTYARAGGLVGYSADRRETSRQIAVYVDRILKGARPADLPIVQPTKTILVVNLKTATALGLTIPQSVLLRADEVIQ